MGSFSARTRSASLLTGSATVKRTAWTDPTKTIVPDRSVISTPSLSVPTVSASTTSGAATARRTATMEPTRPIVLQERCPASPTRCSARWGAPASPPPGSVMGMTIAQVDRTS